MFRKGYGDFRRTSLKIIGAEEAYGANARPAARLSRELVLRLDVHHDDPKALAVFAREIAPAGLAMGPGRCSLVGGRPAVTPLVRLFTFLVPKSELRVSVMLDGTRHEIDVPPGSSRHFPRDNSHETPDPQTDWDAEVPLESLAVARSGDKGDIANIGVIARAPEYFPYIEASLTCDNVRRYFQHLVEGKVERFKLPGLHALNFLLHDALDGGGTASLRNDPLGKSFAQMLLDYPVRVPAKLERALG